MHGINEPTFKSWNKKYNKMKNADKFSLIELPRKVSPKGIPGVLFEVETFEGKGDSEVCANMYGRSGITVCLNIHQDQE